MIKREAIIELINKYEYCRRAELEMQMAEPTGDMSEYVYKIVLRDLRGLIDADK